MTEPELKTLHDLLEFLKPVPHQTFIHAQILPSERTTYIVNAAGECTVRSEQGDMMILFTLPSSVRPMPTTQMLRQKWPFMPPSGRRRT